MIFARGNPLQPDARSRDAGGFTLLEVMLAAVVLTFAITTAITTLQRGIRSVDTARNYTRASQVMQSELERLRLKTWAQIQSLQEGSDTAVAVESATPADGFACQRTIRDVRIDLKEITLVSTWRGVDGMPHSVRYVTRYGKSGLYDYFYTAH